MAYKYFMTLPEPKPNRLPFADRLRDAIQKIRDEIIPDSQKDKEDLAFVRAMLTCAEHALQKQQPERAASYVRDAAKHLLNWGTTLNEVLELARDP